MTYRKKPNTKKLFLLMIGLFSFTYLSAQIQVSGKVTDSQNEPIPGINIQIDGTYTGTTSDLDGKYVISVQDPNDILIYSFIGFKQQRITVANRTVINVILEEDIAALEEVVVVGYGTQKKVNLTGAISSINFEDQALSRPITSVSASLAGLSAGLLVSQTSGQPGSDGASLQIRGVGTLNNNSPLVLIDGMQGSMDDVNPNDIASISILKDGASAAIYGSRAGSGVVLITTKQGNRQEKSKVTYTGRVSIMNPFNLPNLVTNYADFMEYHNEAYFQSSNLDRAPLYSTSTIETWREKEKDPYGINEFGYPNHVAYPNTDWAKEAYNQNSLMHEHNVSITGSSNNIRYLMSMGYLDNPGLIDHSGLERYTVRINLAADITNWLTLGTRTYGTKDKLGRLDFDSSDSNAIRNWIMSASPGFTPKYDGIYGSAESMEENPNAVNVRQRIDNYANGKKDRLRLNSTVYAQIKLFEGLRWDINLNYDRLFEETNAWSNGQTGVRGTFSRYTTTQPISGELMTTSNDRHDRYSYTLEHLLNYNKSFGDHDISALVGYQEYYYKNWNTGASRRGLIDESIHTISSGTEIYSATGSMNDRASRAVFGRINYAWKSRYLFEFNMRYDGHSRFHKDYRWGTFPSVSAGWRLSEEEFMKQTRGWLDNLKIRASWGRNGNYGGTEDDIDYEYQSGYSPVQYTFGDAPLAGLVMNSIGNPMLQWETVGSTNIGIDGNFLNNRLSVEFDMYWKNTTGILYRVSIPSIAGDKTAPRVNLAEMKNNGYELSVGWRDRVGKFNYGISGNFGFSRNEVSKYKGKLDQGWTVDENGNRVWTTNLGDVSEGSNERIVEGRTYQEYFLRTVYKGSGNYFDGAGKVDPNGGPRDGMIRTEKDMEWALAMADAGYTFQDYSNNIGNRAGLYYGDYIYADTNGDGVYGNDADRSFMNASRHPKYTFGFQLYGEWKGIDLSLNFAGAAGFKIYYSPQRGYNTTLLEYGMAISKEVADNHYFYDPENPSDSRTNIDAKYPRFSQNSTNSTRFASDLYLYNGNYLKLKNLTVGYTLPSAWTKKVYSEQVRFYFSGENLFSLDSFPGVDPEQGATPRYQPIKQYAFGVNVTF